ncbi:MAG TPA: cytochrome c, partial [Lacipirellulaceae bacterium]|nr:cytochrome c [Lacipirellulaceae bacterium]
RPLDRWSAIADRPLLMQRMQRALREGIEPHLADARALSRAKADVVHEAELLALLGEIVHREDFEFWDDATFVQHAQEMGTSASELGRAAGDDQYDAARRAAGKATNSCAACHDGSRG